MVIIGLQAEGNLASSGSSIWPNAPLEERKFFYLPLLALKEQNGKIEAQLEDDGRITVPIIFLTERTHEIYKEYLVNSNLIGSKPAPFQIMVVDMSYFCVETPPSYSPKIKFDPKYNFIITGNEGSLTVKTDSPDSAKKFFADLTNKKVTLNATIVFQGYTYQENIASITFDDIRGTQFFDSIQGRGGQGLVNRHQIAQIAQQAAERRHISVTTEYDDPDFHALVESMINSMNKQKQNLDEGFASLKKLFTQQQWDPRDLQADIVTASRLRQNNEFASRLRNEIDKTTQSNAGGSGSVSVVGLFSVGASGNDDEYKREVAKIFEEVMNKWNIEYEEQGTRIIPKSIDVYRNDFSKLQSTGVFSVGTKRKLLSAGVVTVDINPYVNVLQSHEALLEERVASIEHMTPPVGTILPFAGQNRSDREKEDWMLCDGAELSRAEFPKLFKALGETWGKTKDLTKFKLPDLRCRTTMMSGQGPGLTSRILGQYGGEENHTLITAELPPHQHNGATNQPNPKFYRTVEAVPKGTNAAPNHQVGYQGGSLFLDRFDANFPGADHTHNFTTNPGIGLNGKPHNNLPPFAVVDFIIRVK